MAKKNNVIYDITVHKWAEHNKAHKKSYKYTRIANNLFDHPKFKACSPSAKLTYIALLLRCGEDANESITVNERSLLEGITIRQRVTNVLDELQSFQLLSYRKSALNRIEGIEKKERNRIPNGTPIKKPEVVQESFLSENKSADASPPANLGQKLVGVYCELWKFRYKSNPPLRAQDAKNLKQIGETNGYERTKALLEAYLRMNEQWYLKKRHDLASFTNNLTAVAQFLETGRMITTQDLKSFDRAMSNKNTLEAIERGEI